MPKTVIGGRVRKEVFTYVIACAITLPAIVGEVGIFLNRGSRTSMAFPIHRTGWGKCAGSPNMKSRANAAGNMYHVAYQTIRHVLFVFCEDLD